jgi:hypothetical protein
VVVSTQKVEALERDEQGRPSRSPQVVKVVGLNDEQILDYAVHDDGVGGEFEAAACPKGATR